LHVSDDMQFFGVRTHLLSSIVGAPHLSLLEAERSGLVAYFGPRVVAPEREGGKMASS
jgi:hypothetical protein